jgi:HK97 gp10 family phage protein
MVPRETRRSQWFSSLPEIARKIVSETDAAIVAGAEVVKQEADRRLEPHRLTGELERQTHVDDRKRAGVYVMAGDPKDPSFAFWGPFLEFGTRHAPAYPFLVPALEEKRDEVVTLVAEAVRRVQ